MSFWKEFFKSIRHKSKNNVVKICPQCHQASLQRTSLGGWLSTEYYICKECDYKGAFYIEVDPKEAGENFIDMEKLKHLYPEDLDDSTAIDLEKENLKEVLQTNLSRKG